MVAERLPAPPPKPIAAEDAPATAVAPPLAIGPGIIVMAAGAGAAAGACWANAGGRAASSDVTKIVRSDMMMIVKLRNRKDYIS